MGALLLLAGLVAASCGVSPPELEPGQAAVALDGEFAAVDGTSIDLAEFRNTDVVLWFWAPW
jgi:hypothetical protein